MFDTFPLACNLFFLTHILDLHHSDPSRLGPNQRLYFEDTFAFTQHSLVSLINSEHPNIKSATLHQQNCWQIAALIYFNTALRYTPSPNLLRSMTTRLIEALRESDTSLAWHPFEDVLLWVYFMGYVGSQDVFEKRWFMEEAKRIVKILGLKSWDEMEVKMRLILFRQISLQQSLWRLWSDMMCKD